LPFLGLSPTRLGCVQRSTAVDGQSNADAAWFYPDPKDAAAEIKDRFAFWKGVTVEP
jgi:uncharacterized protein (DUF427 family)